MRYLILAVLILVSLVLLDRHSFIQPIPVLPFRPSPTPLIVSQTKITSYNLVDSLVYPSSQIIVKSTNELKLKSTADTKTVTDWYINKIKELGRPLNTTIQTNTNSLIVNQLISTDQGQTIKISITNSEDSTDITVQIFTQAI